MNDEKAVQRRLIDGETVSQKNFVVRDPERDAGTELTVSITPTSAETELPVLKSRQKAVIDSMDDRACTGVLIRIQAHRPDHNNDAMPGFQRGMAASTTCFSYGQKQTGPTTTEYSWIVAADGDNDLREFVKWASFYMFAGEWADENGYETDQVTPDGTIILANGSVIDSPYRLDNVTLQNVPSDFYDHY